MVCICILEHSVSSFLCTFSYILHKFKFNSIHHEGRRQQASSHATVRTWFSKQIIMLMLRVFGVGSGALFRPCTRYLGTYLGLSETCGLNLTEYFRFYCITDSIFSGLDVVDGWWEIISWAKTDFFFASRLWGKCERTSLWVVKGIDLG